MHVSRGLGLGLFAALVAAVGCAATQDTGRRFPAEARQHLRLERTTTGEAEKLLGPPLTKTAEADGRERWSYEHTRVSATRAMPFGRRVTVRQTPYEQLVLTFAGGLLTDCVYVTERYRTEGDVIVSAGTAREVCGRP